MYDADNRIIEVSTTRDEAIYDRDAKYFYYKHGPLARTEIGDNKVQGIDYAYTIQGWIKGINSNTLSPTRDMGQDGNITAANVNKYVSEDIYAFSLGSPRCPLYGKTG